MDEPVLEADHLEVAARGRAILRVERLVVALGEIVGIMGPNGAGKTTLLRCCLGLQPLQKGRVIVLGRCFQELGFLARGRLRQSLGYVPQMPPARAELPLTVREVVAMGRAGHAGLLRPLRRRDHEIIETWMERLGLSGLAERCFCDLSGGEQRKVSLARAMAQEPRILLLDEPAAGLDLGWRERIVALIGALHAVSRAAVLLVCHEPEVLPAACGRVVLLDHGGIVADGAPERVFTPERVHALYGPGLQIVHRHGRHAVALEETEDAWT